MDTLVAPSQSENKPKKKLLDQVRDIIRLKHYRVKGFASRG